MPTAEIRLPAVTLKEMVDRASPGAEEVYLRATDEALYLISAGKSVATYAYYDHEAGGPEEAVEAVLQVDTFFTDVDLVAADPNDTITLTLEASVPDSLAHTLRLEGGLTATVKLPSAPRLKEGFPLGLVTRFTDEGYTTDSGDPHGTTINTDVSELRRIIDVVDSRVKTGGYPIVVEDGAFVLHASNPEGSAEIHGELHATVEGPDVSNTYGSALKEVSGVLKNEVTLTTDQGDRLAATQDHLKGGRIHYLMGVLA